MKSPENSTPEREPARHIPLRRLDADIQHAYSADHIQRSVAAYLESEYGHDGDEALRQLMLLRGVTLPTAETFDIDPDESKVLARMFIYDKIIPLYEASHASDQVDEWLPNAIKYSLKDNDHNPLFCAPDIDLPYESCRVGECPIRFVVCTLSQSIRRLARLDETEAMSDNLLTQRYSDLMRHLWILHAKQPILTDSQMKSLRDELRYNVGEAIRYNQLSESKFPS